jgi:hypothetical protein
MLTINITCYKEIVKRHEKLNDQKKGKSSDKQGLNLKVAEFLLTYKPGVIVVRESVEFLPSVQLSNNVPFSDYLKTEIFEKLTRIITHRCYLSRPGMRAGISAENNSRSLKLINVRPVKSTNLPCFSFRSQCQFWTFRPACIWQWLINP